MIIKILKEKSGRHSFKSVNETPLAKILKKKKNKSQKNTTNKIKNTLDEINELISG